MRLKSLAFAAALCCASVSVPAFADEFHAVTPSGATEAYFDMSLVDTSDLLANKCVDMGWTMVSSTDTTVVCEVPVSFGTQLLSALAGPRYATPPRQYFRFNMAGANGLSRVQASSWQEIQTAFGQNQRTDLASENYHNHVMGFFATIGGIYPPGTSFPNHAYAGFAYEPHEGRNEGLLLTSVEEGGAFDRAGLRAGDILHRVAGERTKSFNDLSDGMHKAIREGTYEVQFYRDGERMEVAVEREYRSAIGALPEPSFAVADTGPASQTTIVQNELSLAEEISRFADLRDRGILSDEEFDAQKARLLSGE